MSYNWMTNRTSPNKTIGSQVYATWGRPRTIEAIAIHWWGDPNANPSFDGVVSWLCNPASGSSAHIVATGTNRNVACIVDFGDASWATNSANPYTISIECDPRCRNEDYDVVAEVIAQLRDAYGDLPLVPHKQFVATQCPGNYDLGRLDRLARTKDGSGDWGTVKNKAAPAPPTPPAPTYDNLYRLVIDGKQVAAYSTDKNAYNGYVYYKRQGKLTYKGNDVTTAIVTKFTPVPETPKPEPTPEPEPPKEEPQAPNEVSLDQASTTLLQDVKRLLEWVKQWLEARFK